ncbi:hypothetical protein [Novosphingobium aquimarinum]|uniref:hypothetical protein n=1 Tax=Novosphingobium aquimarinum TaxID=2682494 RepID=UPI0012EB9595|nr:hypothetical protein [Novosphingobium aquimarinum]
MPKISKPVLFAALASSFLALGACSTMPTTGTTASGDVAATASHDVEGYWHHDRLISSKGQEIPIDGVFLMHDGQFIEQAVMGEPLDTPAAIGAEAMAHSGPYVTTPKGIKLTAEQTIAISEKGSDPLSFQANSVHDITAENTGNNLTLTFGSGTVQTFTRIPASDISIKRFANGRMALTGNRFVLVAGDANAVVSGFGTFVRTGNKLRLTADRWAESTRQKADVKANVTMDATLTDSAFTLADGRTYPILR